jgi:hypothetical protein
MTADTIKRKLSHLSQGDNLTVYVRRQGYCWSKLPWVIEVRCSRQVWPSQCVRGGFSSIWHIGQAKTQETAEKRAGDLRRRLEKLSKSPAT